MTLPMFAFVAMGVISVTATVADEKKPSADDRVAAELTKAKEEYQGALNGAGEKLLAAFTDQQKRLEENTRLKVADQIKQVEQIQEERNAFEADPANLPKSAAMKVAVSDYQTKMAAAKKKCESAFDKAAEGYRSKKDLTMARAVLAEKGTYFPAQNAVVFKGVDKKFIDFCEVRMKDNPKLYFYVCINSYRGKVVRCTSVFCASSPDGKHPEAPAAPLKDELLTNFGGEPSYQAIKHVLKLFEAHNASLKSK